MFLHNCYLKHVQELEFFILKLFKKKIIIWFCGSDSRAPYCDCDVYNGDIEKMWKDIKRKKRNILMLEKYAMLSIDNPASSHFHTKPYIAYSSIGIPIDEKEKVNHVFKERDQISILHAPSNQKFKGREIIRKIINELVDQVYSDTPLAGFATKATINGIPVITSGYYADYYKKVVSGSIPPNVFCLPEELKQNIKDLVVDEEVRERATIQTISIMDC